MKKLVAIVSDGTLEVHAKGSDYASLCGLDGDDSDVGQVPSSLPKNAKINCDQCRQQWLAWQQFTAKDFE